VLKTRFAYQSLRSAAAFCPNVGEQNQWENEIFYRGGDAEIEARVAATSPRRIVDPVSIEDLVVLPLFDA
jgi:hypothetical protein